MEIMDPKKVEALDAFFRKLCETLRETYYFPRYMIGTVEERVSSIKQCIGALKCLGVRLPEADPLIVDLLKSDLQPGRSMWAPGGFRDGSKKV
jgi:hypothetical protein